MEYCEKIVGISVNRKKIMRMLKAATVTTFITTAACGMQNLEFGTAYPVGKPFDEMDYMEKDGIRIREDGEGLRENVTLSEGIAKLDIPVRTLKESIAGNRRENTDISPGINPGKNYRELLDGLFQTDEAGAEDILDNPSIENIAIDAPIVDDVLFSPDDAVVPDNIRPDVPKESIMPDVSEGNGSSDTQGGNHTTESIVPEVPGQVTVPESPAEEVIPKPPLEEIVPDIPGETAKPDIPEDIEPDIPEDVEPDVPSDGDTGNVDVTVGFEVDGDGMIYSFIPGEAIVEDGGYLALPSEGCSGILSGAFTGAGAGIYDIFIPANITYIEENAFYGMDDLFGIDVEEGNPNYASDGGILFDKYQTSLLAFPKARIGTYSVPQGVSILADYSFADTNLGKLDMRACGLVEIGSALFGESDGNGIIVMAPKEYFTEYQEIFAGYHVTVQ